MMGIFFVFACSVPTAEVENSHLNSIDGKVVACRKRPSDDLRLDEIIQSVATVQSRPYVNGIREQVGCS